MQGWRVMLRQPCLSPVVHAGKDKSKVRRQSLNSSKLGKAADQRWFCAVCCKRAAAGAVGTAVPQGATPDGDTCGRPCMVSHCRPEVQRGDACP